MKRLLIVPLFLLLLAASAVPAGAHSMWVNCNASLTHKPGHALVSIGYGHQMPMDDLLDTENATLDILSYELVSPDNSRVPLPLPKAAEEKGRDTGLGIQVRTGDIGLQKLSFSNTTPAGTFQVGVVSKQGFFTMYADGKGRKKWVFTPMDALTEEMLDGGHIIQSCLYQAMAKACFVKDQWTVPSVLGHDLEIIPKTDLSAIRAGELASFEVRFMGREFASNPTGIERITAMSNTYGGPDGFYLAANLYQGKPARIRIPTPGQWLVSVYVSQDVDKNKDLAHLAGKCLQVHYTASLSFHVKP